MNFYGRVRLDPQWKWLDFGGVLDYLWILVIQDS